MWYSFMCSWPQVTWTQIKGFPDKSWEPANYALPSENSPSCLVPASLYKKTVECEEAFAGETLNLMENYFDVSRRHTPFLPDTSFSWLMPSGQFLPTTALRLSRVPGSRSMLKHLRWNLANSWSDIMPSLSMSQILKIRWRAFLQRSVRSFK